MKESFFQFSNPQLIDLNFVINEDFDEELFNGFSIETKVHKGIVETDKEAVVRLELLIGGIEEDYPFHIKIVMSGKFMCTQKDYFEKLLNTNAPALLLSYARPIISLVTSQAGYPAFDLPFMNFTE